VTFGGYNLMNEGALEAWATYACWPAFLKL